MLSQKQLDFCLNYLTNGGNVMKAYIDAGYTSAFPEKNAYHAFRGAAVQGFIQEQRQKLIDKMEITREEILIRQNNRSLLVDTLCRLAMLTEPTDGERIQYNRLSKVLKVADGNKSDEIINKMLGYNSPQQTETKHTWDVGFGSDDEEEDDANEE